MVIGSNEMVGTLIGEPVTPCPIGSNEVMETSVAGPLTPPPPCRISSLGNAAPRATFAAVARTKDANTTFIEAIEGE